jgi:uncharacterized protein (TIGR03435 family)
LAEPKALPPNPPQSPQSARKNGESAPSQRPAGPSLFSALEEQLGLKMEARRASVDVIVIEHIDRPTAN